MIKEHPKLCFHRDPLNRVGPQPAFFLMDTSPLVTKISLVELKSMIKYTALLMSSPPSKHFPNEFKVLIAGFKYFLTQHCVHFVNAGSI